MPWEQAVGFVVEPLLGAPHSQPLFDLGGEVLKEPRFNVLVPWQPALFKAGNHPGPSVGTEINLRGVAAQLNCNVSGRVSESCQEDSEYYYNCAFQ